MRHTMELKALSQTRPGPYFPATDASPCQSSDVTKKGVNTLIKSLNFNYNFPANIDYVLWIPSREAMHVSIFISGITAWYVPLFSI